MSKVFCTGDIHGNIDFNKLRNFKERFGEDLTKDDYVIIAGDFGIIWNQEPDKKEKALLYWLDNAPWTTLFIDGNHENHPRLAAFPEVEFLGGRAHKISNSVYHIIRGEIITINDEKFLCIGGADSRDKDWRTPGISWWEEERITEKDVENAVKNLEIHNNEVDFVIAHSIPSDALCRLLPIINPTSSTDMLQKIRENINRECMWISGHYHVNRYAMEPEAIYMLMYNDITLISMDKYPQ